MRFVLSLLVFAFLLQLCAAYEPCSSSKSIQQTSAGKVGVCVEGELIPIEEVVHRLAAEKEQAAQQQEEVAAPPSNKYVGFVERINVDHVTPVLDGFHVSKGQSHDSKWLYNYNVGYVPFVPEEIRQKHPGKSLLGVAVRAQNLSDNQLPNANFSNIYNVGPSYIVFTYGVCEREEEEPKNCTFLSEPLSQPENIMVGPEGADYQAWGTEDPRLVQHKDTLYMFYTGYYKDEEKKKGRAVLCLATADISDVKTMKEFQAAWKLHGPLFPDVFWSKSAALLPSKDGKAKSWLFYGDSSIYLATTEDLLTYKTLRDKDGHRVPLLTPRSNYFDSSLVESGPAPLPLSDGNLLYLYNSARAVPIPNKKPNHNAQYNLGFVVLNGTHTEYSAKSIIYRTSSPIFSPELDWELCSTNFPYWADRGLTPLVIFVEGWKALGRDKFLIFYQGCDSVMGTAILHITINK